MRICFIGNKSMWYAGPWDERILPPIQPTEALKHRRLHVKKGNEKDNVV